MTPASRSAAAAIGAVLIVAFQLQLLPFFSHLFIDDRLFWPIAYYGCWSLVIGLTLVILTRQSSIFRRALPILAVCAFAAGVALTHPTDTISKNFLVATVFVACASVLSMASAPLALLKFSASATVLSAVICLLDILFTHGFTNSLGRAAGLSINANVAAAGLLLGAASSYWVVPQRLRAPFLLITGAAIFVTLSRSTLLAAIVICTGVGADLTWSRFRSLEPLPRIRWLRLALLVLGLAGWIVAALFSNDRFSVAATSSFWQIGSALTEFKQARQSIAGLVQSKAPSDSVVPPASDNVAMKRKSEDLIAEMGHRADDEGDINSISARWLFMERAFLSYQNALAIGQGLAAAHALQPHNTFLLFAVAFGYLGWLVPIAFLGLTVYWVRSTQQLPLFLATFTVMATSHDILLTPGLLAPIALGFAGLNSLRYEAHDALDALSAVKITAVAAPILFAFGGACIAGVGHSGGQAPPVLLLLLVFAAITLWSIAVWLWLEVSIRPRSASPPLP